MTTSSLDSEFREGVIRVVQETDGILAVCLEGEFDLANTQTLSERLAEALNQGTGLVVDLNEATFIDSTVVKVLVQTVRSATEQGKPVILQLAPGAIVEGAIQVIGIERILPRALDRQEAVRLIRQNAEIATQRSFDDADPGAPRVVAFTYVNTSIYEAAIRSIASASAWDFFCECGDLACTERITLTPTEYKRLRDAGHAILAIGHRVDETVRARALREDAQALCAQAQHQARRARQILGELSRDHE